MGRPGWSKAIRGTRGLAKLTGNITDFVHETKIKVFRGGNTMSRGLKERAFGSKTAERHVVASKHQTGRS